MRRLRVLLICYYFPPLGGAGIGRPLSLFKYLGGHNIDCDVLTVKPVTYRVYEPDLLETLDQTRIFRAGSLDPQRLLHLFGVRKAHNRTIDKGRVVSERFFPDAKIGWVRPAIRYGRQLLSNRAYDLILSTSPPVSCHLVAKQLCRESRLPWIADFRDLWTAFDIDGSYGDERLRRKGRRLLDDIKAESSCISAVNEIVRQYVGGKVVIGNSYDAELAGHFRPNSAPDKFVIGLYGSFNDLYPVRPLLETLNDLFAKNPEYRNLIRLQQVGNCEADWLSQQLREFDLADLCETHGFLPRAESIAKASDSSCFYISVLPSNPAHTTGKIYYMLASGRPILAVAPPGGELEKLLAGTNNCLVFSPENRSQAVEYLLGLIRRHQDIYSRFEVPPDYAKGHSSEEMVRRFAELVQDLISQDSGPVA